MEVARETALRQFVVKHARDKLLDRAVRDLLSKLSDNEHAVLMEMFEENPQGIARAVLDVVLGLEPEMS